MISWVVVGCRLVPRPGGALHHRYPALIAAGRSTDCPELCEQYSEWVAAAAADACGISDSDATGQPGRHRAGRAPRVEHAGAQEAPRVVS
jgi:hypothetical protein